jgi:type IV pilus assembly protein PilV
MTINRGFSLIEVLISVLILSIGLLGVAGLQISSIQFNQSAQLRSIAISQISNMVDRMMANQVGINTGLYNSQSGIPTNPECSPCSPSQIAFHDLYEWNNSNRILLPNGQGTVVGNNNRYIVTVRWDNYRQGASGLGCSGNPTVDLTCVSMEVEL